MSTAITCGRTSALQDQAGALVDLLHADTAYPGGSRVLEAGCGVGAQTVTLAQRSPGARFTSVDISADSIAEAKRRADRAGLTNVEFQQADIFALPFEAESFDHVFVCFVLEHLSRPVEALAILKRLLRPGGTITVIEGDHGSTYFYPDSPAAHAAIQCQVTMQREAGGNALIGRQIYPLLVEAGFRRGPCLPPDGVRRCEPAGPRRWVHAEDVHRDDRGHSRVRACGGSHRAGALRCGRPRSPPNDRGGRCVLLYVLQGRGREGARRLISARCARRRRNVRTDRQTQGDPWPRDALAEILLDGAAGMPGCLSYVIATDPTDGDAIWITEVWESQRCIRHLWHCPLSNKRSRRADRSSQDSASVSRRPPLAGMAYGSAAPR